MLRFWRLQRVNSLFARFDFSFLSIPNCQMKTQRKIVIKCLHLIRLEKDIRFNYFCTRCTKLVLVSLKYLLSFYLIHGLKKIVLLLDTIETTGNSFCSALCWVLQLLNCWQISWCKKNMDRRSNAELQRRRHVDQICNINILVNYNTDNNWIWWLACWEPKGNVVQYLLHAIQFGPHSLPHWQHD